jgi:hypothetical protein
LRLGLVLGLAGVGLLGQIGHLAAEDGTAVRFRAIDPSSADRDDSAEAKPIWRIEWGQSATAVGPIAQSSSQEASVSAPVAAPIVSVIEPYPVTATYQADLPSILIAQRNQSELVSPSNRRAEATDWQPKPFDLMGVAIELPGGQLPRDYAAARIAETLPEPGMLGMTREWAVMDYNWVATAFCHRPLYFEEANLERYGYGCNAYLQPAASAAHFFGTVPALPYCMALDCPRECVYTLGHYRPGSPNPWRRVSVPKRLRAAFAEGGVWTGLIFLIP